MENVMKCQGCTVCVNADIRLNAFDYVMWRAELGWEQWLNLDMEAAARLDDPMSADA